MTSGGASRGKPVRGADDVLFTVMDASAGAVIAVDAAGLVDEVNPAALRLFGYAREEILGLPVERLVGGEFADGHPALRTGFQARPTARPMGVHDRLVARRSDGTEFPVQVSLTPIPTDDGVWTVAAVVDMTVRRQEEERLRRLSLSYQMLSSINQAILRARDDDDLFREVCRVVVEEGGFHGAYVGRRHDAGQIRVVATAGSMDPLAGSLRPILDSPEAPWSRTPAARALSEKRSNYIDDLMADEHTTGFRPVIQSFGIRATMSLPLFSGAQVVAALTIHSDQAGYFDEVLRGQLDIVADNVGFALTSLASARRLDEVAAHRSDLLVRLVTAQEAERERIAADVHDDPVQELAAIDLRMGLLQRRVDEELPGIAEEVSRVHGMVGAATRGLRELLFELEPADLGSDLVAQVREAADHVFEGSSTRWRVDSDGDGGLPPLPDLVRTQAFRILKEALINARKHAQATEVAVRLRRTPGRLVIEVVDDGVGLRRAVERQAAPGHRGLVSMRDRAEVLGGVFQVEGDGAGTRVRVRLPVPDEGTRP